MIYDSKSNTIKKQITKNLIVLEMSRFYQVALFRPFLTQQNQRNWRDVYICQERKTLSAAALTFRLSSDLCVLVAQSCPTLQAPLSMEFSRQEWWSGLPFSSPGDLPNPEIKPQFPCTTGRFFTVWATREAGALFYVCIKKTPSSPAKVKITNYKSSL